MLWLYFLGAIIALVIALRRVLQRQTPLSDELYSTKVAFDHLQSGVAWVRGDGTLGTVNSSAAATLSANPKNLIGRDWLTGARQGSLQPDAAIGQNPIRYLWPACRRDLCVAERATGGRPRP